MADVASSSRAPPGAPPVAARASTPGGCSITIGSYNVGVSTDEMFQGRQNRPFKKKLFDDLGMIQKVMDF